MKYLLSILLLCSCGRSAIDESQPVSNAVLVYDNGVTKIVKIRVDSAYYLVATRRGSGGPAIIKHEQPETYWQDAYYKTGKFNMFLQRQIDSVRRNLHPTLNVYEP